jgi:glycosyltransferase involved in cell wall biosynthesis
MSLPKVSVIIPNYNYGKYIAKTVDSVLSQTYKCIEVVVVDDGSKDDSLNVLKNYGEALTVIRQQNQGVSPARNNGVRNSTGELLAFLDADDIWLPEKLERQVQRITSDGDVGLVHCAMSYVDINDNVFGENRNGLEGWIGEAILRLKPAIVGAGSTGLVRRHIFDEVGGFDPRQTTAADWDFCYRVASRYKVAFVDEPLVLYRIHNSNMHSNVGAMEKDMRIGLEKAFASGNPSIMAMRAACYADFHYMLAGSYFHSGQYAATVSNAIKSLWYKPTQIGTLLSAPLRRLRTQDSR